MGSSCCKLGSHRDHNRLIDPNGASQVSYSTMDDSYDGTIIIVRLRSGSVKDICGSKSKKFIIQNYVEVDSLKDEISTSKDRKLLRDTCQYGDHYLAQYSVEATVGAGSCSRLLTCLSEEEFYIIKGDSCIVAESLSRNTVFKERIFGLHPECQGGSHYFANRAGFYIIRSQDSTYLHVKDMSEHGYQSETASHCKLHETFTDGEYYFATDYYFYVVKDQKDVGLVYHRTKDLRNGTDAEMLMVSPSITASIKRNCSKIDQPQNRGTYVATLYENNNTVVSRKSAHGRCILH